MIKMSSPLLYRTMCGGRRVTRHIDKVTSFILDWNKPDLSPGGFILPSHIGQNPFPKLEGDEHLFFNTKVRLITCLVCTYKYLYMFCVIA